MRVPVEPAWELQCRHVVGPWEGRVDGGQDEEESAFDAARQMRHHGYADQHQGDVARAREFPAESLYKKTIKSFRRNTLLKEKRLGVLPGRSNERGPTGKSPRRPQSTGVPIWN